MTTVRTRNTSRLITQGYELRADQTILAHHAPRNPPVREPEDPKADSHDVQEPIGSAHLPRCRRDDGRPLPLSEWLRHVHHDRTIRILRQVTEPRTTRLRLNEPPSLVNDDKRMTERRLGEDPDHRRGEATRLHHPVAAGQDHDAFTVTEPTANSNVSPAFVVFDAASASYHRRYGVEEESHNSTPTTVAAGIPV